MKRSKFVPLLLEVGCTDMSKPACIQIRLLPKIQLFQSKGRALYRGNNTLSGKILFFFRKNKRIVRTSTNFEFDLAFAGQVC